MLFDRHRTRIHHDISFTSAPCVRPQISQYYVLRNIIAQRIYNDLSPSGLPRGLMQMFTDRPAPPSTTPRHDRRRRPALFLLVVVPSSDRCSRTSQPYRSRTRGPRATPYTSVPHTPRRPD